MKTTRGWTFFVGLSPIADPALVGAAVATALGLAEEGDEPLETLLLRRLRSERLLLLLDNFEHVLEAAGLVGALLEGCAGLKVLVTSRVPLHLSGEREYEVPPLPPDDAATLFVHRARAVGAMVEGERAAVEAICHRLDGLPLAIELAAARAKLLSPAALLRRLEAPLGVLTGGARDRPERQQTLRAAIDWSYGLLDEEQQGALAALSVFAGGSSLEAAEAVTGAPLDVLAALVDASLVRRRESTDGEPRLSMLQTIREYARGQLVACGREHEVALRHAEVVLESLDEAVGAPRRSASVAGATVAPSADDLAALDAEQGNIRAALGWAFGPDGAPDVGVRIAARVGRYWELRGRWTEGRSYLDAALAASEGAPPLLQAQLQLCAGRLGVMRRDAAAVPLLRDAAARLRESDDVRGLVLALANLDEASGREALATARAANDSWAIALALNNLGVTLMEAGDVEGAAPLVEESTALRRTLGDELGLVFTLDTLADVALARGDLERAGQVLEETEALARRAGHTILGVALVKRAFLAALHGEERSTQFLQAGMVLVEESRDPTLVAIALHALAASTQAPLDRARLLGGVAAMVRDHGVIEPIYLRRDRRRLTPDDPPRGWAEAFAVGSRTSLDQAIALVRGAAGSAQE